MSAISLNTIHTIERDTQGFDFKASSFWVSIVSTFSFIKRISFSKWFSKKLTKMFTELHLLTEELNANFDGITKKEATELLKLSSISISRFIKLKENLEEINYFENEDLKNAIKTCLKSFYSLEAKSKKLTFETIGKDGIDEQLKISLVLHSKESIEQNLSRQ